MNADYEQSAGRAVSEPRGIGANTSDWQRRRSLRFGPPTPPWQRLVSSEGVKKCDMTISRHESVMTVDTIALALLQSKLRTGQFPCKQRDLPAIGLSI